MELRDMIGHTETLDWVLLALFLTSSLIQSGYYLLVYLRFLLYKPETRRKSSKGISVIICARNEAENLARFLPGVLEQDYPEFEVVVVNDGSADGTEDLLSEMTGRYSHLRFTSIPANEKFTHGKKLALTVGLKSARYDHVLLTDADCYPVSNQWLQKMASNLTRNRRIVLGYGGYERGRGLLNSMIRYETVFTAIQYLSFAIKGRPYMGVGRNLAYEKSLFFENRGFASHYHLRSGDDDLFINEIADGSNTVVEISRESHTWSIPEPTFRDWVKQKQRHLSAGTRYNTGTKIRLAGELISRTLYYTTAIVLIIDSPWRWPVAALFGLIQAVRLVIFKLGFRRLDEQYLLLPSFMFDPIMPLLLVIIWFSNIFVTRYQPWH